MAKTYVKHGKNFILKRAVLKKLCNIEDKKRKVIAHTHFDGSVGHLFSNIELSGNVLGRLSSFLQFLLDICSISFDWMEFWAVGFIDIRIDEITQKILRYHYNISRL